MKEVLPGYLKAEKDWTENIFGGYKKTGEMYSRIPRWVLENHSEVEVTEKYFTGERSGGQYHGTMTGEDAAELLRDFDLKWSSNYPNRDGFSWETLDGDMGPEFSSWDSYELDFNDDGGEVVVRASDPILGFFPRNFELHFELDP